MGYSVSTPMKSNKARKVFYDFLDANLRPFLTVMKESPDAGRFEELMGRWPSRAMDPTKEVCWGGMWGYGSGRTKIGFNFHGGAMTYQAYMYAICCWLALRGGRRRKLFGPTGGYTKPVPYFTYDSEASPVLLKTDPDIAQWIATLDEDHTAHQWLVDDLGCRRTTCLWECTHKSLDDIEDPTYRKFAGEQQELYRIVDLTVKEELERLDTLWCLLQEQAQ